MSWRSAFEMIGQLEWVGTLGESDMASNVFAWILNVGEEESNQNSTLCRINEAYYGF